jgi:hypothetical protein
MMNNANFPITMQKGVWTEAAATSTSVNTVLVASSKQVASYNTFYKKEAPFVRHLLTFGKN